MTNVPATVRQAYIECALWSSTMADPYCEHQDVSLDDIGLTPADLSADLAAKVDADLAAFFAATSDEDRDAFADAFGQRAIGHDLWLTRNGHGAGFWSRDTMGTDGDLDAVATRLTDAARDLGEDIWYANANGHVDSPIVVESYT